MKYALLIYDTNEAWERLSEQEQQETMGHYMRVSELPGVYGGAQLQSVQSATTLRVDGGETLLTDGPFVESKEFFGGYYLVEADDIDGAIEVARQIPAASMGGAIEIRPIVER